MPPQGTFLGLTRRSRELHGLVLVENDYAPGLQLPVHAHEHPFLTLVLRGTFTERVGRTERLCVHATLLFHPAGESHGVAIKSAGAGCFNLELREAWCRLLAGYGSTVPAEPVRGSVKARWLAAQLFETFRSSDGTTNLLVEDVTLRLMEELISGRLPAMAGPPPRWLGMAIDFLQEHFLNPISFRTLAGLVDVHPVHIARVFRRHVGRSVGEYVRELRFDYVRRELVGSGRPIAAIAHDAGFADQSHLSRVFRDLSGMSPAAYRRRSGARSAAH